MKFTRPTAKISKCSKGSGGKESMLHRKERNCNRGNAQFLKKPKDFIFSGRGPKFVYPSASTSALLLSSSSGSGGGAYPTDRFYIAEQSPIGSPQWSLARLSLPFLEA